MSFKTAVQWQVSQQDLEMLLAAFPTGEDTEEHSTFYCLFFFFSKAQKSTKSSWSAFH